MIIYYENSNGEKINLLKAPYRTIDTDVFDSSWDESDSGFEKRVSIDVFGNKNELKKNMEYLYNVIAVDSEKGVCGKLYVNDTYLYCNIRASRKTGWKGFIYSEAELTFVAPELKWIHELRRNFYPKSEVEVNGLNFPFNFPFNFTRESRGSEKWKIDHVAANDFQMIIFGPCDNPKIFINGHPYEMLCSLQENEYLVIDSMQHTIMKYGSSGGVTNMFNERGFEYSVFEKIPSGTVNFTWTGSFGFELLLFVVRREPLW